MAGFTFLIFLPRPLTTRRRRGIFCAPCVLSRPSSPARLSFSPFRQRSFPLAPTARPPAVPTPPPRAPEPRAREAQAPLEDPPRARVRAAAAPLARAAPPQTAA